MKNNPCNDCITYPLCKARYKRMTNVQIPGSIALLNVARGCIYLVWHLEYQINVINQPSQLPIKNPLTKRTVIFLGEERRGILKMAKDRRDVQYAKSM